MSFFISVKGHASPFDFNYIKNSSLPRLEKTHVHGAGTENPHPTNTQPTIAADIMTKKLITLSAAAKVAEAIELIKTKNIHHLPVLVGQVMVGMISDRDLLQFHKEEMGREIRLHRLMEKTIVCASESTSIQDLAAVMYFENISAIPIINDQLAFVGIVSSKDILKWVINS